MSAFTPGARVQASWLGGGWQPAKVLEVNSVTGLVRVQFDDGRESWLSSMNVRAAPAGQPAAPTASASAPMAPPGEFRPLGGDGAVPAGKLANSIDAAQPNAKPAAAPDAQLPPPPGEFRPIQGAPADVTPGSSGPNGSGKT